MIRTWTKQLEKETNGLNRFLALLERLIIIYQNKRRSLQFIYNELINKKKCYIFLKVLSFCDFSVGLNKVQNQINWMEEMYTNKHTYISVVPITLIQSISLFLGASIKE